MGFYLLFPPALTLVFLFLFSSMLYKKPKNMFYPFLLFSFGFVSLFLRYDSTKELFKVSKKVTKINKGKTKATSIKGKVSITKEVQRGFDV